MTALLTLVVACGGGSDDPSASSAEADAAEQPERSRNDPGLHQVGEGRYEVVIQASEGGYNPPEIRIPVGSEVTFRLLSVDVPHGFFVEGAGVKLSPVPEEYSEAVHVFDSVGTHEFFCDEYCGAGHDFMRGRIIVE